jgi:hypothetical protein
LEGLGWRLVRIWSTDWVRNRDRQVQRVLAAVAAAATPLPPPPPPAPLPAPASVAEPTPVPQPRYKRIEDVPSSVARSALLGVLGDYGVTSRRDALKAAATRLGFEKLGKKIEARLGDELDGLTEQGTVHRHDEGRVGLAAEPARPATPAGRGA